MRVFLINASILAGVWLAVVLLAMFINKVNKKREPLTRGHAKDITIAAIVLVGSSLLMAAMMNFMTGRW